MAALFSEAELELYLGRPLDTPTAELTAASVSALVRAWCGWEVTRTTETLVLDGPGGSLLSLPTLHLHNVTEVRVDGAAIDASTYAWSHVGQMHCEAGWPYTMRSIEVDAIHGFDPVPDAIKAVGLALAGRMVENPQNFKSVAIGTSVRAWQNPATSAVAGSQFSGVELSILGIFRLPITP